MTDIGQNLYPKAPDMRLPATQDLTDGELYWIIENGVRLTGMPAWGTGDGNDLDTWKQVHFIRRLKELGPDQLKEMEEMNPQKPGGDSRGDRGSTVPRRRADRSDTRSRNEALLMK